MYTYNVMTQMPMMTYKGHLLTQLKVSKANNDLIVREHCESQR